jgi:predicted DNA-binding transcriptional regulator AlpA
MPRKSYYGDEISLDTAAAILGHSRKTLTRWHSCGDGPPRKETFSRRVSYSKAGVENWKAEHEAGRTPTTRRRPALKHATNCKSVSDGDATNCKSGHPLSDGDASNCKSGHPLSDADATNCKSGCPLSDGDDVSGMLVAESSDG